MVFVLVIFFGAHAFVDGVIALISAAAGPEGAAGSY
jgi:hypothetical protein